MLVEKRLTPADLRRGRNFAGALLAVALLAGLLIVSHAGPMMVVAVIGLALGLAYSAPPIRLCTRGLGEVNVAVTHSFLVVLAGYASQAGPLTSATPWFLALPLALAVLPSITLAGFPDFEADSATGKRTLVVRLGRHRAAMLRCHLGARCRAAAAVAHRSGSYVAGMDSASCDSPRDLAGGTFAALRASRLTAWPHRCAPDYCAHLHGLVLHRAAHSPAANGAVKLLSTSKYVQPVPSCDYYNREAVSHSIAGVRSDFVPSAVFSSLRNL